MSGLLRRHLDATALRVLALDPAGLDDAAAAHLAACDRCQARAADAHRALDAGRAEAHAAADAAFSAADIERQRRTIAARIARGYRSARVLPFPGHDTGLAVRRADRRWLAAAAAAGLVMGALAGQLPHLLGNAAPADQTAASRSDTRPIEDTLLSEVEAALDSGTRPGLWVLDALTPVHYEIR